LRNGESTGELHPLQELCSLAGTAGATVVECITQRREKIDPAYYVGRGKAEEIRELVRQHQADVVIFDNDLSPSQIRELEVLVSCKIVDRSELILDIFATRARTHEARLQVELAQLEYTAPRLRGMWTHLERIAGAGGGTGAGAVGGIGTRGPGERQIEIDRRLVNKRVAMLRAQLREIRRRRSREVQARSEEFTVSLVGYTNAGKSTLMNALTDAGTFVEDKLFATLDTMTRRWELEGGRYVLLSDTVGFVRDLPHHLVASFRATLEEATHADLLLHVVDASVGSAAHQYEVVCGVLQELGVQDNPTVVVLNKMDAIEDQAALDVLRHRIPDALEVSARTGFGVDQLVETVMERMSLRQIRVELTADLGNGKLLAFLNGHGQVLERHYDEDRVRMRLILPYHQFHRLRDFGADVQIVRTHPPMTNGQ
jgi:GTP-binding protein HflX